MIRKIFARRTKPLGVLLAAASPLAAQTTTMDVDSPDGPRLHVEIVGSGADTLLVPFASLLAEPLAPLAANRTVVFYDMRGRGRSDRPADPEAYAMDREVEDMERVRAALGVERVDVLGYSYLGAVAALYAQRYPRHVRRLVLLSPIPPRADLQSTDTSEVQKRLDPDLLARVREMRDSDAPAAEFCHTWWKAYLPLYVGRPERAPDLLDRLFLGCGLANEGPDHVQAVVGRIFASVEDWDWSRRASEITAPTLVLHGDRDLVAPLEGGEAWARAIPGARMQTVPGAGHLAWAEESDRVLERIDAFLGEGGG